jgi:hypothetical protein
VNDVLETAPTPQHPSFSAFKGRLYAICYDVLKGLSSEGVFGQAEARSEVVVQLLADDQGQAERLRHVRVLNPPAAFKWYRSSAD